MKVAITNNAKILATFAIVCTIIIGLVNELTKDKIKQQAQLQLLDTLHTLIASERLNNDIYQDCQYVNDPLLGKEQQTVYLAKFNDAPVAAAITATAPDGYNGNIELIVAININGSISGVRTLKHKETPGLGDKIEVRKSQWINNFEGQSLSQEKDSRWAVKKDGGVFDQFTGATITPRAVVKAVKKANLYFQKNQQQLFANRSSCRAQP